MGLFSWPHETLRETLSGIPAQQAEKIFAVLQQVTAGLSSVQRREVEGVVFGSWVQDQLDQHDFAPFGDATVIQVTTAVSYR